MNSGMRRALQCLAAMAVPALFLVGCNESTTPTEPKVAAMPTPVPLGSWSLTVQVTAATGGFCIYLPDAGNGLYNTTYTLQRSGNSVSFLPEDPIDWESYTATLNGLNFTSTNPTFDSGRSSCAHYRQMDSLSGSFSEDGKRLSATEVWSFTLDSGEVVTRTFHWSASRG